jgi:hypothetical protein
MDKINTLRNIGVEVPFSLIRELRGELPPLRNGSDRVHTCWYKGMKLNLVREMYSDDGNTYSETFAAEMGYKVGDDQRWYGKGDLATADDALDKLISWVEQYND